jgi:hypothetical protein
MIEKIKTNLYSIVLHIIVLVLSLQVYLLSEKLKLYTTSNEEMAKVGDVFYFSELKHIRNEINYDTTKQTIVFVFTTKCPFCKTNIPIWNSIDSICRINNEYQSIGICLDADENIDSFINEYHPMFSMTTPDDPSYYKDINKIRGVPVTLIRDEKYVISKLWVGSLTEKDIAEITNIISAYK